MNRPADRTKIDSQIVRSAQSAGDAKGLVGLLSERSLQDLCGQTSWHSRRSFLGGTGLGLGTAALGCLLAEDLTGSEKSSASGAPEGNGGMGLLGSSNQFGLQGLPGLPHHLPKAKRVIFLCMAGGPSHLETFDYKPELDRLDGQTMPASFTTGQPIAQLQGQELTVQGHLARFSQHGESGQWVSDYLPHQASMVDELCIVRSMVTDQINHDPAHTMMNTGTALSGRPSMGAWISYGLGSECHDLPSFVVLTSQGGRSPQPIASRQWSAGFLPGKHQGVEFNSSGAPVHYVENPAGVSLRQQQQLVRTITELDRMRRSAVLDPELEARIAAYEMAFRMQSSVPSLVDMGDESQKTFEAYGAQPGDGSFASNCLLARRLVERGVRFVHLYHRGWDHHGDLQKYMDICCRLTDQPVKALLMDLKQRGMLDETLVIWGGEFGRTPMFQGKGGPGRDHHIKGFTMWLAGGGVRPGMGYGSTDDLGYHAVDRPVHIRDLHATMLHLLGIDYRRFSFRHQGLEMRLTGVEPARVLRAAMK